MGKMEKKRSLNRRSKRQPKIEEENSWECSVCTYRNSPEAFKCLMCDVRKGTSTRKAKINPQLVAQQVAQQYIPPVPKARKDGSRDRETSASPTFPIATSPATSVSSVTLPTIPIVPITNGTTSTSTAKTEKPEKKPEKTTQSESSGKIQKKTKPKLKNPNKNLMLHEAITVNNVTVIIREFDPKKKDRRSAHSSSSSGTENGHHSDSTNQSEPSTVDSRTS